MVYNLKSAEDATFPATKDEIIAKQGWKLFDCSPTKRIRVAEALKHIPNKKYQNLEELIETLSTAIA